VQEPTPSTFTFFTWFAGVMVNAGWAIASIWIEPSPIVQLVCLILVAVGCTAASYLGTARERKRASEQTEAG
jgi:drug/metabolite transporter (DMT)-like permease